MRVATFNLHAGVDGWGRPTHALEHALGLGADVLICPEVWRGDDGTDFFEILCTALSMKGTFAPLARAERVTTGTGGATWQPRLAHFTGERGLYFLEHRTLSAQQRVHRAMHNAIEHGSWGIGLFTSLEVQEFRLEELGRLSREKVRRALIVAKLLYEGQSVYVLAVHGAHLSHGSFRQYRTINQIVKTLEPSIPVIAAGDFNSWRFLLRVMFPGWRTLARAKTWPARHPHSQIDHILGKGPWRSDGGRASDGGSDHRALVANITLAPKGTPAT